MTTVMRHRDVASLCLTKVQQYASGEAWLRYSIALRQG